MEKMLKTYLQENEGKTYYTVTDKPFTYELRNKGIYISRVKDIGKETFTYDNLNYALAQMPVDGPSGFCGVMGTSYCYAILKDFLKCK